MSEFCAKYDLAKHLFEASQMPRAQERIFEELGLFDDPILWLRLESTFAKAKYRQQQRASNDTRRKGRA